MPKYKEISDEIKHRIKSGIYLINDQIPDELTLCHEFNCSRMTIKKALDILVLEGIIYRKRGHGSFVMNSIDDNSKFTLNEGDLNGLTKTTNGKIQTQIIEFNLIFSDINISSKLNINESSPVYEISRVRLIDNTPIVFEKTYMSPNIIPGITTDILKNSIYEYIENNLNLKISSAKKIIRASKSNELDIKYLGVDFTDPILEVEQIAYLSNGTPFEYSISRHRYDKFEFTSYSLRT